MAYRCSQSIVIPTGYLKRCAETATVPKGTAQKVVKSRPSSGGEAWRHRNRCHGLPNSFHCRVYVRGPALRQLGSPKDHLQCATPNDWIDRMPQKDRSRICCPCIQLNIKRGTQPSFMSRSHTMSRKNKRHTQMTPFKKTADYAMLLLVKDDDLNVSIGRYLQRTDKGPASMYLHLYHRPAAVGH